MTELTEERSGSTIASERLEAEIAERLKLEKDLQVQQNKLRSVQDMSEKLEMELICAKSDMNGFVCVPIHEEWRIWFYCIFWCLLHSITEEDDAGNDEGNDSIYRMKYERTTKELEFTKRRLQTQHEHDLDQLIGLKKQLEKKLFDAYEEVEEQRQVVGQWKRKTQKLSGDMNDLRMLLDEQNGRNNLLEKRQRKFDAENQSQLVCVAAHFLAQVFICFEHILFAGYFAARTSGERSVGARKRCSDCWKI